MIFPFGQIVSVNIADAISGLTMLVIGETEEGNLVLANQDWLWMEIKEDLPQATKFCDPHRAKTYRERGKPFFFNTLKELP